MEKLERGKRGGILAKLLLPVVQYFQLGSFLEVFLVRWIFKEEERMGEIILEAEEFYVGEPGFMGIRSSCEDIPGNGVEDVVRQL